MRRYLPASGTAGFDRSFVRGYRRVPLPPPSTSEMMLRMVSVVPSPKRKTREIPGPSGERSSAEGREMRKDRGCPLCYTFRLRLKLSATLGQTKNSGSAGGLHTAGNLYLLEWNGGRS